MSSRGEWTVRLNRREFVRVFELAARYEDLHHGFIAGDHVRSGVRGHTDSEQKEQGGAAETERLRVLVGHQ